MKATHVPLLCIGFAAMLPLSSHADDLVDAPFSLRFPAAFSNFSFYGDVSALSNASAASKWESSPNPANKAWGFQEEYDWRLSGQYNNIRFDNGTQLHLVTETVAIDAHDFGVLRLGLLQVTSNDELTQGSNVSFLGGKKYAFDLNGVGLSWGRHFGKSFTLGSEVGFTRGETVFTQTAVNLPPVVTPLFTFPGLTIPEFEAVHTDTDKWSYRVGGLWSPADKWFVGLYADYARATSDTTVSLGPLSPLKFRSSETIQQWVVHPGIAYEFTKDAMVHADYQAGWVFDDYTTLQTSRWSAGTDIKLAQFLYLRVGGAIDSRSNTSWSTGIGFYPSKHVFIDLAYQNDAFPELNKEFGRSRTLNASVSIHW